MKTREMRIIARAKLNLGLRVLGRDQSGYHRLETVFHTVELHDVLRLRLRPGPARTRCWCSDPHLPIDDANLAWRAIEGLRRLGAELPAVEVFIEKRIPSGGGLGGGSADAAAVLRALAHHLPATQRPQLAALALSLGADIPFLLRGGCAYGLGRGEILDPLPSPGDLPVWLAVPPFGCATAAVFAALTASERRPRSARGRADWRRHWKTNPQLATDNDLLAPALRVQPALGAVVEWAQQQGCPWGLSGSGSTIYLLGPPRSSPPAGVTITQTRLRAD